LRVAFASRATNLVPGDTNQFTDIFVRDSSSGQTTRVSVDSSGGESDGDSDSPSISSDGRYVAFVSVASNLVPSGSHTVQIYVHDCQTGATEIASVSSLGQPSYGFCQTPRLSGDGRLVTFSSWAMNLVPNDYSSTWDVFVHDRQSGRTSMMSVSSSGAHGNGQSLEPSISADGRFVAFGSDSTNLAPGGGQGHRDIYVHDRVTRTTERVSVDPGGAPGDGYSGDPSISADGRFISFRSFATNLVPGGSNGYIHVYLRDQFTGPTTRCSVSSAGAQGIGDSNASSVSADGRFVAFESTAINLIAGDTNGCEDVFLRDRGPELPSSFCSGDGSGAACPCANSGAVGHGCENSAATGGAMLSAMGASSLSTDTLVLRSSGELPSALSIFLQGGEAVVPVSFGDGLRCIGGTLLRLYTRSAYIGVATAPQSGDASVSARSAVLGDLIPLGASRFYQTYYRDPSATFCPAPNGGSFNVSSALAVVWSP
jgi:Tol biopolymer transport system component